MSSCFMRWDGMWSESGVKDPNSKSRGEIDAVIHHLEPGSLRYVLFFRFSSASTNIGYIRIRISPPPFFFIPREIYQIKKVCLSDREQLVDADATFCRDG